MHIKFLLIFLFFNVSLCIFAGGGRVNEADIPMPGMQYELPDDLIGEFILINSFYDCYITIYPHNKFITLSRNPLHVDRYGYGYIIKRDNRWYLIPLDNTRLYPKTAFLSDLTEITYTDNGYIFHDYLNNMFRMRRKIDISGRQNIAENISIGLIRTRQQYYILKQSNTEKFIDFQEIQYLINPQFSSFSILFFHELIIRNGYIEIRRREYQEGSKSIGFMFRLEGFIEIHEENENIKRGTIQFTNGIPYYHIKDGTAIIEISNENIKVIMECTAEVEETIREKIPDIESPVYLVFEFEMYPSRRMKK